MKIRLATPEIQRDSIVDGEGIRCVIWTQGCIHNCQKCHNPETHSFTEGFLVDVEDIKAKIKELVGQDGITFSGGDPMEQPEACALIAEYCQEIGLNVWCYTGYTYEELLMRAKYFPKIKDFLTNIDILIDGKFDISKKSYDAIFRGSTNQRIIDVKESLVQQKVVLASKYNTNSSIEKTNGRKNHYMYV